MSTYIYMIKKDCKNFAGVLPDETKDFVHISKSEQLVLTLNKFKTDNLPTFYDNSFGKMLIIGKREAGTTTLIKNLIVGIMNKNVIKKTIIVTNKFNKNMYKNIVSNCDNICTELTNEFLQDVVNTSKKSSV